MPLLYREAPLNSVWEGSGNVNALDVLRALSREPEVLDAWITEVGRARGGDAAPRPGRRRDPRAARRRCWRPASMEATARRLAGRMAACLQGSLLVRFAPAGGRRRLLRLAARHVVRRRVRHARRRRPAGDRGARHPHGRLDPQAATHRLFTHHQKTRPREHLIPRTAAGAAGVGAGTGAAHPRGHLHRDRGRAPRRAGRRQRRRRPHLRGAAGGRRRARGPAGRGRRGAWRQGRGPDQVRHLRPLRRHPGHPGRRGRLRPGRRRRPRRAGPGGVRRGRSRSRGRQRPGGA